jgi:hypothetical protein
MATAAGILRFATKQAMPANQNARKGMSDSNELPLITNAGTAKNSRVAHNGWGEKRLASDHMERAAITEKTIYAA